MLPHVYIQELNWFTADSTVFNHPGRSFAEHCSSSNDLASETGMNIGGPLIDKLSPYMAHFPHDMFLEDITGFYITDSRVCSCDQGCT